MCALLTRRPRVWGGLLCLPAALAVAACGTVAQDVDPVAVESSRTADVQPVVPSARTMPDVVGNAYQGATAEIATIGISRVRPEAAFGDVTVPADPAKWKVCFQDPEAGTEIADPAARTAVLSLTRPGAECPDMPGMESTPTPTPVPARPKKPKVTEEEPQDPSTPEETPSSESEPEVESEPEPEPEPSSKAPRSVHYENCTAARAAGAAPLSAGDPGYSRKLDRDGDGVACE
ncbi:excalibur calcium-binding domain-containing protein [Spirillospora sp. CA-253888]